MNLTTIRVPNELHTALRLSAEAEGYSLMKFVELLVNGSNVLGHYGKKYDLSYCSVINATQETRKTLKMKAIKAKIPMHRYIEGLLNSYNKVEDPLLG